MLHNSGRKVEEGGSLETRLSAGEEHAKKKSPIGRRETVDTRGVRAKE